MGSLIVAEWFGPWKAYAMANPILRYHAAQTSLGHVCTAFGIGVERGLVRLYLLQAPRKPVSEPT